MKNSTKKAKNKSSLRKYKWFSKHTNGKLFFKKKKKHTNEHYTDIPF